MCCLFYEVYIFKDVSDIMPATAEQFLDSNVAAIASK